MNILQGILEDIIQLELTIRKYVKELNAGIRPSVYKGIGFDFEEYKEYEPGIDDVRRIDWNLVARNPKKVYVKRFREEKRLTVWIMADLTDSMKFGFRDSTKKELLTKAAATIGFSATHEQDRVGLIILTDKVEKTLMPRSGRTHVYRLLEEIWGFDSSNRQTDLAKGLEEGKFYLKPSNMVFLLSDFADYQCFQIGSNFWRHAEEVSFRRDLIPVVLDEDKSFLPNNAQGNITIKDLESGKKRILQLSKKSYEEFLKKTQERYWMLKKSFMEFGVRPMFVAEDKNLDKLFKFFLFRKRERR